MVHQQLAVGPDEGRLKHHLVIGAGHRQHPDGGHRFASAVQPHETPRGEDTDPGLIVAAHLAEPLLGDDGFQAVGEVLDMHGVVDAGGTFQHSVHHRLDQLQDLGIVQFRQVRHLGLGVSYTPSSRVTAR